MSTEKEKDAKTAYVEHSCTSNVSVEAVPTFPENLTLDVYYAFSAVAEKDVPPYLMSTVKEVDAKKAYVEFLELKDAVKAQAKRKKDDDPRRLLEGCPIPVCWHGCMQWDPDCECPKCEEAFDRFCDHNDRDDVPPGIVLPGMPWYRFPKPW